MEDSEVDTTADVGIPYYYVVASTIGSHTSPDSEPIDCISQKSSISRAEVGEQVIGVPFAAGNQAVEDCRPPGRGLAAGNQLILAADDHAFTLCG